MVKVNTYEEFLSHEVAVWGEDEIFSLLDKGYEPVQLNAGNGEVNWTWRLPVKPVLTKRPLSATVTSGSDAGLLPFLRVSRP